MPYDVVIIGAGIIGTILARDLSRYHLKVAVLEKENDIADGATMANSAIVHTGYNHESAHECRRCKNVCAALSGSGMPL